MTVSNLRYVSDDVLESLRSGVVDHLERYVGGDFQDLSKEWGWAAELKTVQVDLDQLGTLQPGATSAEAEIINSLIVHDALKGMSRAVAREERVWTRLTHVECLPYARSRWLKGANDVKEKVERHFFAGTLTQVRDDNALGRLWWNAEIARIASPGDIGRGLNAILRTADIRLNFVERTGIASRPALAQGIVRALEGDKWLTETEANFRVFMRVLNRNGGGVLFEALPEAQVDQFLEDSSEQAQALTAKAA
jgi:hypothetical protein